MQIKCNISVSQNQKNSEKSSIQNSCLFWQNYTFCVQMYELKVSGISKCFQIVKTLHLSWNPIWLSLIAFLGYLPKAVHGEHINRNKKRLTFLSRKCFWIFFISSSKDAQNYICWHSNLLMCDIVLKDREVSWRSGEKTEALLGERCCKCTTEMSNLI